MYVQLYVHTTMLSGKEIVRVQRYRLIKEKIKENFKNFLISVLIKVCTNSHVGCDCTLGELIHDCRISKKDKMFQKVDHKGARFTALIIRLSLEKKKK